MIVRTESGWAVYRGYTTEGERTVQRRIATRLIAVGLTASATFAVAAPAIAKGPQQATITGPGIEEPVVVSGDGEFSTGSEFSMFTESTGFWQLVFGEDFNGSIDGVLDAAPTVELGDEYLIEWDLGSSDAGDATVTSMVYPNADGGPFVHVEPGTWIVGYNTSTAGGWFEAPQTVSQMIASLVMEYDGAMAEPATKLETVVDEIPTPSIATQPVAVVVQPVPHGASTWVPTIAAIAVASAVSWTTIWAYRRRPQRLRPS